MSLFNPYVLLGIVLTVLAAFGGGYYKGEQSERDAQALEIAQLNAEARQKEQALTSAVNAQAIQLTKATQNAKLLQEKRNSDIDSGALRLRVPQVCPVSTPADSTAPARDSVQTNAELDRETAKALVAITDDGDKAIRQLNACIDAYTSVYQTLRSKQ